MIVKGTLKNGFKYEYDDKVFHLWRFIKAARDAQNPEKATAFVDVVELILGEEQCDKLCEYIESKGEDVTVEMMGDIVQELTDAVDGDEKN